MRLGGWLEGGEYAGIVGGPARRLYLRRLGFRFGPCVIHGSGFILEHYPDRRARQIAIRGRVYVIAVGIGKARAVLNAELFEGEDATMA